MARDADGEVPLWLLTVTHAQLVDPIRVVLNTKQITSRGNIFLPFPFSLTLPEEREEQAPQAKLVIDGVDRTIVQVLRTIATPPLVTMEFVLASSPDIVELNFPPMRWKGIAYNVTTVEGILEGPRIFFSRFPKEVYSPTTTPGVFFGGPNL